MPYTARMTKNQRLDSSETQGKNTNKQRNKNIKKQNKKISEMTSYNILLHLQMVTFLVIIRVASSYSRWGQVQMKQESLLLSYNTQQSFSLLSIPPSSPHTSPLSCRFTDFPFPRQKEVGLHIQAGQDNPEGKEHQGQARVGDRPPPLLGVPQNHQANSHDIHTEDLVQIHAYTMLAASVSVRPCEPCLVDSMDHVFLVSPIPSSSCHLSSSSSLEYTDL